MRIAEHIGEWMWDHVPSLLVAILETHNVANRYKVNVLALHC